MSALIDCLNAVIAGAADPDERRRLEDARKAAEIIASIPDAVERRVVLAVLEKLDVLTSLADDLATGRVVPFPRQEREPFFVD